MNRDFKLLEQAMWACPWVSYGMDFYDTIENTSWDPQNNDGDAFRMAVRLNIVAHVGYDFDRNKIAVAQTREGHDFHFGTRVPITPGFGEMAATRLAILKVAAEIGRHEKEREEQGRP